MPNHALTLTLLGWALLTSALAWLFHAKSLESYMVSELASATGLHVDPFRNAMSAALHDVKPGSFMLHPDLVTPDHV